MLIQVLFYFQWLKILLDITLPSQDSLLIIIVGNFFNGKYMGYIKKVIRNTFIFVILTE